MKIKKGDTISKKVGILKTRFKLLGRNEGTSKTTTAVNQNQKLKSIITDS